MANNNPAYNRGDYVVFGTKSLFSGNKAYLIGRIDSYTHVQTVENTLGQVTYTIEYAAPVDSTGNRNSASGRTVKVEEYQIFGKLDFNPPQAAQTAQTVEENGTTVTIPAQDAVPANATITLAKIRNATGDTDDSSTISEQKIIDCLNRYRPPETSSTQTPTPTPTSLAPTDIG